LGTVSARGERATDDWPAGLTRSFAVYAAAMKQPNPETRNLLLVVALIAAFEIFRPAPATTQPSMTSQMRDVISELRGIRNELASIARKVK